MDLNKAIAFAQLVNKAYDIPPANLANSAGTILTVAGVAYTVVTTIYANDLATDMNPDRCDDQVSIGLICQAIGSGDVVIAIRGTEGIDEWIHDAEFLQVKCPILPGSGQTEDGFTAMYNSLSADVAANTGRVIEQTAGHIAVQSPSQFADDMWTQPGQVGHHHAPGPRCGGGHPV